MPDPAYEAEYGPGPHLTADAVVVRGDEIVLILRKKDGLWALPGGFVDVKIRETITEAALRELKEEAGLDLAALPLLIEALYKPVAFDAPDRDPRSWMITGAVGVLLSDLYDRPELVAGDDAEKAEWWKVAEVPQLYADHNTIIKGLVGIEQGEARLVTS